MSHKSYEIDLSTDTYEALRLLAEYEHLTMNELCVQILSSHLPSQGDETD